MLEEQRADGMRLLDDALASVDRAGGVQAEAALLRDPPARVSDLILAEAGDWRADLIVMGTHGRRGLSRLVMGSDAQAVVRASPVPVMLVRAEG